MGYFTAPKSHVGVLTPVEIIASETKCCIVLPSGRKLQIITQEPVDLVRLREFMATQKAVTMDVILEDDNPGKVILWGDVLSHSYLEVK